MNKILFHTKKEFEDYNKLNWDARAHVFNCYSFVSERMPKHYPCVATVCETAIPDSYVTEYGISFVYLQDFNK